MSTGNVAYWEIDMKDREKKVGQSETQELILGNLEDNFNFYFNKAINDACDAVDELPRKQLLQLAEILGVEGGDK
tara:strand:- start:192 stop:416 length:225 start_codon:yes stop_codon:yes gene_type:complete